MDIMDVLTLVFGLAAAVLGILLKAEFDKRMTLQQQVAEDRRKAYAKFNALINDLMTATRSKNPVKQSERVAKQLADLRQEIWQFGSDDVVRAYAVWNQSAYALLNGEQDSIAALVLMADVIVKMRQDMGLSKKNGIKPIDILRIFITDIEDTYNEHAAAAAKFRKELLSRKYIAV